MQSLLKFFFFLWYPLYVLGFYEKSDVIELNENEFKNMLKSDEVWVVEFYAPWCGHCKALTPEYKKAASTLKGVVKMAAVDATQNEKLAQKYQIQGFPTIKVFGTDKKSPVDYQGERTADGLINEAMKTVSKIVKDRQKGGASGSSGKSKGSEKEAKKEKKSKGSDVVELTEANFNALVLESDDIWMVEFFAPWCGHCKKLAPEWESAASQLKGQVRLGAVDATAHTQLAAKYEVKGYPTIKVFNGGKKGKVVDYQGPREANGIVEFAINLVDKAGIPPSVTQITSQSVFDDQCSQHGKICVLLFVPHILDTGASGRNEYLEVFTEAAAEMRGKPFAFVWSEGGAQPKLESAINMASLYPQLAVYSGEKNVYAIQMMSWSKKNIVAFLNGVLSGREKTSASKPVSIVSVPQWDGKDGEVPADEISLEDLMKD